MTRARPSSWLLFLVLGCSSGSSMPTPTVCSNISGNVMQDGLTLRKPEADVACCHEITNPAGPAPANVCMKKDPDLSCVGMADPLGTPVMVTFSGCVAAFGLEAQSNDLTVTVLKETVGGTPTNPGYDVKGAPGMQSETTPGALVGHVISSKVPEAQCKDLGAFQIPNVPTETNLIVRVTDQHKDKSQRAYVDTYQYNVILRNSELLQGPMKDSPPVTDMSYCAMHPCYGYKDANTVYVTTFKSVALSAGVSTIDGSRDLYDGTGQGHLAGQIHDCTSLDRLQNAVVALDATPRKLAYFNVDFPPSTNDIEDPRPDQSRTRTNADGLYAAIALDTMPGGTLLKAGAIVTKTVCGSGGVCKCNADGTMNPMYMGPYPGEGDTLVLGTRTVYVLPDSITIFSFDRNVYTKH